MRVKEYKEMMKTMTEHEEYKNADVPKEIWIQRNEYLHKHIDNLYEEIKELRTTFLI